MRILLISEFFPTTIDGDFSGGVEAYTFFIARELAKRHKVTILCSYIHGSRRFDHFYGFDIVRVGPKRKYNNASVDLYRFFYTIAAMYKGLTIDTDIIQGTNFVNQIIAYIVGTLKRIPIVSWTPDVWRGSWIANTGILSAVTGELIERFNLSHRDVSYIAISQTVAKKMEKSGVPKKLIRVIPCGIDLRWISQIKSKKEKRLTICVISRLVQYKNLHVLLDALPFIKDTIPIIKLNIIGEGPEEKKLKQRAKDLEIEKQVHFFGHIPHYTDLIRLLKSAHVFSSPSTTEGYGIATMEAMAVGTPFVVADTAVHREITGQNGGLFFQPDDPKDLAEKIIQLLTDKLLYAKARREGKKYARQYDWRSIAKQTEAAYEGICNH